jgi:hypothetical protein
MALLTLVPLPGCMADVVDLEEPEGEDGPGREEKQPPQQQQEPQGDQATAAQAKSAAAKSLLSGDILSDVVALHRQLFGTLAALRRPGPGPGLGQAPGSAAAGGACPDDEARERLFGLCYQLGAQLAAAQRAVMPAGVDAAAAGGHLMRACQEHRLLDRGAPATAALAAAAAAPGGAPAGRGGRGKAGAAAFEADAPAVDMQVGAVGWESGWPGLSARRVGGLAFLPGEWVAWPFCQPHPAMPMWRSLNTT